MKSSLPIIVGVFVLVAAAFVILRTQTTQTTVNPANVDHTFSGNSAESGNAANSMAIKSEPATGFDLNHMDAEQFKALSQEVTKSLPTKSNLAKLPSGEILLTPGPVLDAGEKLGQIATAVGNNPSLAQEALAFYLDCANSSIYPDSIRALCLSNYRMLGKKQNLSLDEASIPLEIKKLAEKLQGL